MKVLEHVNLNNNSLEWIDVDEPNRSILNTLAKSYNLHHLHVEDCLSKIQLPKVDKFADTLFVILHFPAYNNGIPKGIQLSIFVGFNFLITVHKGEIKPLTELFNICKSDNTQRIIIMSNPVVLLHKIIDMLVDELLHVIIKIEGNIEDIEDLVFDEKISAIKSITYLRREILALRRIIIPLRRVIADIARESQRFSSNDMSPYWNDVKDHVEKAIDMLDVANETINIYKDTDFILSSEKTNKILAVLTIIFTLSIPATLIATFYGMNVILPGGVNEPWMFFGKYTTLIVTVMLSAASALFMLYYFYRKGWLYEK